MSKEWKKICSICASDHCPEANIDDTEGCCLCYNITMLNKEVLNKEQGIIKEEEVISVCSACYKHAKVN